jgi:hypothetical protein
MGEIAVPQRLLRNPNNVITDSEQFLVTQNEIDRNERNGQSLAI